MTAPTMPDKDAQSCSVNFDAIRRSLRRHLLLSTGPISTSTVLRFRPILLCTSNTSLPPRLRVTTRFMTRGNMRPQPACC